MKTRCILTALAIVLVAALVCTASDGMREAWWNTAVVINGHGGEVTQSVEISGVPANAYVTSVRYEVRVDDQGDEDNFWCSDYEIYIGNDRRGAWYHRVWDHDGAKTDDGADDDAADDSDILLNRTAQRAFDGDAVNQKWWVAIRDNRIHGSFFLGKGKLINFHVWIYYHVPQPDLYDNGESYRSFSPQIVVAGEAGQDFRVVCHTRNGGDANAQSFAVSFYLSADRVISTSDHYLGDKTVNILGPGYTPVVFPIEFPTDVPPGTYYVGWIIDKYNAVDESDETNNTAYKEGYQLTVLAQVAVPDVVGMSEDEARSAITDAGLVVGTVWYSSHDTVPAGHVISEDPAAGTVLPAGSTVVLDVSTGPAGSVQVTVPDVVGMSQSNAELMLVSSGLALGTVTQSQSNTVLQGNVISQAPAAGTQVAAGFGVNLVVSSGPQGQDDSGPAIPPPLVRWKLDETAGPIAYESSGSNLHGVLFGNPIWQPYSGKIDGALRFDGYDDYVELPIGPLLPSLTDSTFATWVNWSGTGGNWQRIFDFGSGQTVNMYLTPRTGHTQAMYFGITTGGSDNEDGMTAPQALATGWHHVAVTIDAASNTYLLYLDGQVKAIKTSAQYTPSSLGTTVQNWLGRSQYTCDPYFNGLLDDFQIYDYALSETEIPAAMSASFADRIFGDAFEIPHDYLTEGLGFYDGLLNGSIRALDANDTYGGALYMETRNSQWEPGPGPLLYVNVTGDFVATVRIADFAGTIDAPLLHNAAGIMARDPASDGGLENWISIDYFPTWTGFVAWDTIQGFRAEHGEVAARWTGADTYALAEQYPYIQLERAGQDFYFRISADGVDFIPLTDPGYQGIYDGSQTPLVLSRPDLPATLQVGLHQVTSSQATGYAAFDDFIIQAPEQ